MDPTRFHWWMQSDNGAMRVWLDSDTNGWVAFEVHGFFATDHEAIAAYARNNGWFEEEMKEQHLLFAQQLVRLHEREHRSQVPNALRPFDFACRACCPVDGHWADDSVQEGWVCAYHQAKAVLEGL
jgi:hypothetical protein